MVTVEDRMQVMFMKKFVLRFWLPLFLVAMVWAWDADNRRYWLANYPLSKPPSCQLAIVLRVDVRLHRLKETVVCPDLGEDVVFVERSQK